MAIDASALQLRGPSPEWIENRCNYLGGTDIAAIMGLHPYKTPRIVYMEKKGLTPPPELNQAMVHGTNLELYVAQCYRAATGRTIHKSKFYQDKEFPFLGVNPDYEIRGEKPSRLLECKTAGQWAGEQFGAEGDAVPNQYLVQCMWQLALTGREICDLAVLIGGQDFRMYTVTRDEPLITELRRRAIAWWRDYIEADFPPPLTGDRPDNDLIKRSFPDSCGESCYADPETETLCEMLRDMRGMLGRDQTECDRLINEIKIRMADAGELVWPGGKITWRTTKGGQRPFKPTFKEVPISCQAQTQPVAPEQLAMAAV